MGTLPCIQAGMSDAAGAAGMSDGAGAAGILLAAAGRRGLDAFDLATEVSGCGEAAEIS
jgi:ABC-type arginine/histidine transport system permease subunit